MAVTFGWRSRFNLGRETRQGCDFTACPARIVRDYRACLTVNSLCLRRSTTSRCSSDSFVLVPARLTSGWYLSPGAVPGCAVPGCAVPGLARVPGFDSVLGHPEDNMRSIPLLTLALLRTAAKADTFNITFNRVANIQLGDIPRPQIFSTGTIATDGIFSATAVPEPSTWVLLAIGLGLVLVTGRNTLRCLRHVIEYVRIGNRNRRRGRSAQSAQPSQAANRAASGSAG
jgi:hypothetical protein